MPPDELSGPDLDGVVADANAVGLEHVVIGGFAVIYHGYVRATKDSDLLVPDGPEADAAVLRFLERIDGRRLRDDKILTPEDVAGAESLRINSRHGIIDIMRGGLPPLDYDTVAERAEETDWEGQTVRMAALPSSSASSASRAGRRIGWISPSSKRSTASCRSSRSPGWTHSRRTANRSRARRVPTRQPFKTAKTRPLTPQRASACSRIACSTSRPRG